MKPQLLAILFCAPITTPAVAQWRVTTNKDEISDQRTAVFRATATNATANAVRLPQRATLVFRCADGKIDDAYVVVNAYVEDETTVNVRYDTDAPSEEEWSASSDNTALFAPDGNGWLLQEVTTRLPGRIDSSATTFASAADLADAMRRAEAAHGEHEKRTGERDADWPTWYAEYMVAEQAGRDLPQ